MVDEKYTEEIILIYAYSVLGFAISSTALICLDLESICENETFARKVFINKFSSYTEGVYVYNINIH